VLAVVIVARAAAVAAAAAGGDPFIVMTPNLSTSSNRWSRCAARTLFLYYPAACALSAGPRQIWPRAVKALAKLTAPWTSSPRDPRRPPSPPSCHVSGGARRPATFSDPLTFLDSRHISLLKVIHASRTSSDTPAERREDCALKKAEHAYETHRMEYQIWSCC